MIKSIKYIVFPFSLFLLITGCSIAYRVLLGVDSKPEWQENSDVIKSAKKHDIPEKYNLVLDTVGYFEGLKSIYTNIFKGLNVSENDSTEFFKLKRVLKDDTQPVQFRLFESNGNEIFKLVNCYLDPPIPMNWNVDGCFDEFPPRISIESLNSHNYDLQFLLANASFIDQKKVTLNELPQADYYGVIFWNEIYKKPSKKLIKTIRNKILNRDESVVLLYINNQNALLWQSMDSKTKERVKSLNENE